MLSARSYASTKAPTSSNTTAQAVSGPTSPGRGKHRRTIKAVRRQTSNCHRKLPPPHQRNISRSIAWLSGSLSSCSKEGSEDSGSSTMATQGKKRVLHVLLFEQRQHTFAVVFQLSIPLGFQSSPAPLASGEAIPTSHARNLTVLARVKMSAGLRVGADGTSPNGSPASAIASPIAVVSSTRLCPVVVAEPIQQSTCFPCKSRTCLPHPPQRTGSIETGAPCVVRTARAYS